MTGNTEARDRTRWLGRAESGAAPAAGAARGRGAASPSEVPAQGWRDVFWRITENFSSHRILSLAAAATFYTLLALFPAIGALISLYGVFADPAGIASHAGDLSSILPSGATDIIQDQVRRLAAQPASSLSAGFFLGLAVALWSASAGIKAMFDAMNIVYEEDEQRSFARLSALALIFTLGGICFLLLAIGAVIVLPVILNIVGLGGWTDALVKAIRWPLLFALTVAGLAVLYRYGPDRQEAKWRWVTWGSALAAVLWVAASLLFSWYVQNFGSYNRTYGSLGAVAGFMTWIWLSITIFLLGAELNAELEHQTERDTTTSGGKPLGGRGAVMADSVGGAVQ